VEIHSQEAQFAAMSILLTARPSRGSLTVLFLINSHEMMTCFLHLFIMSQLQSSLCAPRHSHYGRHSV